MSEPSLAHLISCRIESFIGEEELKDLWGKFRAYAEGRIEEQSKRIADLEAEVARLRDYALGDARCPCCGETRLCLEGCAFATDAPKEAKRMEWARDALRPEDIAREAQK